MPHVLHDIGGDLVGQIIVQHPVIHALVIRARALEDLFAGNGKLRTTWGGDLLRDLGIAEDFLPGLRVVLLTRVARLRGIAEWLHFVRAAGRQLTPEIDEAFPLDKVVLQGADGVDVVKIHGIDVPSRLVCTAVRVQEHDDGGEVIVVVDEELEVRESLTALILRSVIRDGGIVDSINEIAPSRRYFTSAWHP